MNAENLFLSLNKQLDWNKGWLAGLVVDEDALLLASTLSYTVIHAWQLVEPVQGLVDFTVAGNGVIYLLDRAANLWMHDLYSNQFDLYLKGGNSFFSSESLICSAGDLLFTVNPADNSRISAISLLNGQVMWSFEPGPNILLYPLAVVTDSRQYLYILALVRDNQIKLLKLDYNGRLIDTVILWPEQVPGDDAYRLRNNFQLAAAPGGQVLLLNSLAKVIHRLSFAGGPSRTISVDFLLKPGALGLDSARNIYLGETCGRESSADDSRFLLKLAAPENTSMEKIIGYRGRVDKIILDRQDNIFIWNAEKESIAVLKLQKRMIRQAGSGLYRGTFISVAQDSNNEGNKWHKLFVDAEIPAGTQIAVSYFASDQKYFVLNGQPTEINSYIKDSSITFEQKCAALAPLWTGPLVNPSSALLQEAQGRYLWLKIDITGSEVSSPILKRIRLYFPGFSCLQYLPQAYQEDQHSSDFLDRFLAIFETMFSDMEEKVQGMPRFFDVDIVPVSFIKWLASWMAISVNETWSMEQLRLLMQKAPTLYAKRGTPQGLKEIIEIYTGEKPLIVEHFQIKNMLDQPDLKETAIRLYGNDPYTFCVLVKQELFIDPARRTTVYQIIEKEKPAFTEFRLIILQPWIYLDLHSYLGINTYLSERSVLRLDRHSAIPFNTLLTETDRDGRVGMHIRLELDTDIQS